MNLGVNAHDAMGESGMVRIKAEQVSIEDVRSCASCHTNYAGNYLMISVRDSGVGIPAENLLRIFDPFFSRRADGEGGTGLGLTICKSIIERYAGSIEVSSHVGQGAVFRVFFPLVKN